MVRKHRFFLVVGLAAASVAGCGASSGSATSGGDAEDDVTANAFAASASLVDGEPKRVACTEDFGTQLLGNNFGRLDGVVVAVVPPGRGRCHADRHHVHLQVLTRGSTYDVAINTDGGFLATTDAPLPGDAWADGWHPGGRLDYARDLGLHTSDFTTGSESDLAAQLEAALATANHVSVYATKYSRGGVHLVHRRGHDEDGLLVTDPFAKNAHVFAFHFSDQEF